MRKAIVMLLMCAVFSTPITVGKITVTYGEIEKVGHKYVEVNAIGTNQGFVIRDKGYRENIDYIVVINNKKTKKKSDDKLIKIMPVKKAYKLLA